MQKQIIQVAEFLLLLIALSFIFGCKKEHLQPITPPAAGNTEPLVFITANLDDDSVYFAGGVNNYVGIPSMVDTFTNFRMFNFSLQNSQLPFQSYFKISINNYQTVTGDPQTDLDSSIYPGNRDYMFQGVIFIPLFVQVYWVDDAGDQFESTSAIPNSFSIISVTDTVADAKHYKKTMLEFECYLQNNSGTTIHLTNGSATVLFSAD
ncbi:MAG TPA: hypothetical protein VJY62_16835 [Bacteroidia bacterium]|nr:hypothetical protein [Bacteroidia bacterium]